MTDGGYREPSAMLDQADAHLSRCAIMSAWIAASIPIGKWRGIMALSVVTYDMRANRRPNPMQAGKPARMRDLGSGLVLDHSQNRTVAAKAIAERYVSGHLS